MDFVPCLGEKTKKRREREDGILISNYDMNFVCGGDAFCFSGKRFQDERRARASRGPRARATIERTLQGSFSAVSKLNFVRKYAFESSRRDLHNALLCTAL